MAEKKKILYIVEAMGGGVFTYIVDLANELVNKYDMYIAYGLRYIYGKWHPIYFGNERSIWWRISVLPHGWLQFAESNC